MRLSKTHDIDLGDSCCPKGLLQARPVLGHPLETRIGCGILALLHADIRVKTCQRRMELSLGRARDTMRRPGVHEIGSR